MELINILKESCRARRSRRKALRKYGLNDDAELRSHWRGCTLGKTTRIILNWVTLNAKNEYEIELRIMVPEEQMVYKSRIRMRSGTMFVQQTRN